MSEEHRSTDRSRREFLKQACKTSGYVIPAVAALKLGSLDAWADNYVGRKHEESGDHCSRIVEKVFNPSCW